MKDSIVLGGGCFWCVEAAYQMIRGVLSVTSGYAGGSVPNPSYQAVSGGSTGHAEVVKVEFDPAIISLEQILDVFWAVHNPTTLNKQGNDVGTQYRSIILYSSDDQKEVAEKSIKEVQKLWPDPLVTELKPIEAFYTAEDYHQNYFKKNPANAYCQVVINPKLTKLRQEYEKLLV